MDESNSNASTGQNVGFVSGGRSLPSGTVLLSPDQVHELNMKTIENWSPSREMLSLKYGAQILGGMAAISGFMFITHLRRKMLLRNYGRLASLAPTVFFPGVITTISQQSFVTNKVLSGEMMCPVCAEVRSVSIQLLAGVTQPFVLAILASSALAKTALTYPLPPLNDFRTLFQVYVKLLQPMRSTALFIVATSVFNAFVVAYNQGKAVEKVHNRILEQHNVILK